MKKSISVWLYLLWLLPFVNGVLSADDNAPVVLFSQSFPTAGKRQEWKLPRSAAARLIQWPSKDSSVSVPLQRVRALSEARWAERLPGKEVRIESITLQNASQLSHTQRRILPKEWDDRWFYVAFGVVVSKGGPSPEDDQQLTLVILGDCTILEPTSVVRRN